MADFSPSILKNKKGEWSRFIKLLSILMRFGFSDFLSNTGLKKWVPNAALKTNREDERIVNFSTEKRIRLAIEEMGTTYIKLGQVVSNRQDLFPKELIDELSKLQDEVPPIPDFNVHKFLDEKYDEDVNEIFASVETEPLAAASIAQVHKAKLNDENNTAVVIKILRPEIEGLIKADIAVLKRLAIFLNKNVESMRKYQLKIVVDTFEDIILKEINLKNELYNAQRFKAIFKGEEDVVVPDVYDDYSMRDVLVMEFISGTKVSEVDQLNLSQKERKKIAKKGVSIFYKQIMEKGFYHADPHPGNFFIFDDMRISFIDFGMMGVILPEDQSNLGDLLFSVTQDDPAEIVRMIKIIAEKADLQDEKKLSYQINDLLQRYEDEGVQEIDMRDLTLQIRKILSENDIVMPAYIFQLMRTLMIVEGIGVKLDPDFNIIKALQGYVKKLIKSKLSPRKLIMRGFKTFRQVDRLTTNLPANLNEILQKLNNNKLQFAIDIKERRRLEKMFNKVANRVVVAILIGALIVGSALIFVAQLPPFIFGMPALGFIGFTISGVLGLFIIITIIRRDLF